VRQGEKVNIVGEVKRLPGNEGQVTVTDWGPVSESDAKMLENREVYVYASRIEVTK
jgi:hypothetical protein